MPTLARRRPPAVTDEDLLIVAEVAAREGWSDLAAPPTAHDAPRTLREAAAVERFSAAAARTGRREPAEAGRTAKTAMLVVAAIVLGVCWYVSPARTALALLGVGLFCLVSLRRRKKRAARGPRQARTAFGAVGSLIKR